MSFLRTLTRILDGIEQGTIQVQPQLGTRPMDVVYKGGLASYRLSNGWFIRVFNDCGAWDYVDSFRDAEGKEHHLQSPLDPNTHRFWHWLWEVTHPYRTASTWRPSCEALQKTWGWRDGGVPDLDTCPVCNDPLDHHEPKPTRFGRWGAPT